MIRAEPVKELPQVLFDNLVPDVLERAGEWKHLLSSMNRMSWPLYYIHEDEKPLFGVGAMRLNFFPDEAELWLFPTGYLTIDHLRLLQTWFSDWLKNDYIGPQLYARIRSDYRKGYRTAEFFGGKLASDDGKIKLYRWE